MDEKAVNQYERMRIQLDKCNHLRYLGPEWNNYSGFPRFNEFRYQFSKEYCHPCSQRKKLIPDVKCCCCYGYRNYLPRTLLIRYPEEYVCPGTIKCKNCICHVCGNKRYVDEYRFNAYCLHCRKDFRLDDEMEAGRLKKAREAS